MERDEVLVLQKAWNSELHLRYKTGMYACTTCGAYINPEKLEKSKNKKRQVFSTRRRTMTDTKPNETSLALLKTLMDSLAREIVAFDSHNPRRIDLLQELLLLNELAAEMRKKRMPVIIQRKNSASK